MSQLAPFVDAAASIDRTAWPNLFISYYTYGSAIALGLDLTLRDRTDGKLTAAAYMQAVWRRYGRTANGTPGMAPTAYTVRDLESTLGEVSGDPAFAREYFERFIEGREVVDYATLFRRAGLLIRKAQPGRAWLGSAQLQVGAGGARVASLVPFGSPLYKGGVAQDDQIVSLAGVTLGQPAQLADVLQKHTPGDTVEVEFVRRGGERVRGTLTFEEDPRVEVVTFESAGQAVSADQQAFRNAWLGRR